MEENDRSQEAARVRSILQSPLGLQMRPLAEHLAFKTQFSVSEAMTALWYASQDRRAPHGAAPEESTRIQ